jgi:2,3,4,5-tetrahydropyridine-2-carboxylate N-succinyltransferase
VVAAVDQLDAGEARVARGRDDEVVVDERAKRAILLSFKVLPMEEGANGGFYVHDRVPLKTSFPGVRVVAGAIARWGQLFEPGVVLMPSYTNIGGYVAAGSMVDTWATVGSCAQIGRNVHLSGGVGIGGVLEPPQAAPVVVEDDAFIGSRSMVVEGARVRAAPSSAPARSSPPAPGSSTPRPATSCPRGEAPERAVCVGSSRVKRFPGGDFGMPCLLVLRSLEPGQEHDKLALNDVLREHGVAP